MTTETEVVRTDSARADEVDTKTVAGRRTVRYESYDDLLADAERLAGGKVTTIGNWSYGQILDHLAKALGTMIDGIEFRVPLPMRLMMMVFMKKKFLNETLPPGFKIGPSARAVLPEDISVEEGLDRLRTAIARAKSESKRAFHPALGNLPTHQWDQFQYRHCELHMSFVLPAEAAE